MIEEQRTFMPKRILVSGISGFIGTHFLKYFLNNTDYTIIGIDSFRHKGTYSRINSLPEYDPARVRIYHHDLTVPIDQVTHRRWLYEFNPPGDSQYYFDYIINLASNSAVERSISNPVECWKNNCDLISNILEFSRGVTHRAFFQISTDEVYGDYEFQREIDSVYEPGGESKGFKEWSTILPSNPYAASKAAQEALCISYWRTYRTPIVLTNTMNNVGEWQDTEKFLPRIISQISQDKEVSIYTDDKGEIGSRVYLDAQEHAAAIHHLMKDTRIAFYGKNILKLQETENKPLRFNICGNEEYNNLEVAEEVAGLMGKELKYRLVPAASARPGYDKTYLLDPSLLASYGWKPSSFEGTLKRIIDYSLANPWWLDAEIKKESSQKGL